MGHEPRHHRTGMLLILEQPLEWTEHCQIVYTVSTGKYTVLQCVTSVEKHSFLSHMKTHCSSPVENAFAEIFSSQKMMLFLSVHVFHTVFYFILFYFTLRTVLFLAWSKDDN